MDRHYFQVVFLFKTTMNKPAIIKMLPMTAIGLIF